MARNKYLGSWRESTFESIERAFSAESFRDLLLSATGPGPEFTHQQIADWSLRFWREVSEGSLGDARSPDLKRVAAVALDVDAQWDMYLSNTYSLSQLQTMDFSQVRLPLEWFDNWLSKLNASAV